MRIFKRNVTAIEPMLEVEAGEEIAVGTVLKMNAGKAVKATGTTKPTYYAMGKSNDGKVNVVQVLKDMEYEAEVVAAEGADKLTVGQAVTLGTDGLTVTATTTSGVAEIVALPDGTLPATGGRVIIRFN